MKPPLLLCAIALALSSCQTAGVQLAGRRKDGSVIPAHLRLPIDADHVHAHLTQNSCDLDIAGLRSSPAILAQGAAAHDVENGGQGLLMSLAALFATHGMTGVVK